jgi:hypothetical protein
VARRAAEAAAARAEAERVVERRNRAIAMGRDVWWSPTMRCAIVAGTPWLDVYCPGCNTSRVIDIRTFGADAQDPGLHALPPAGQAEQHPDQAE